MNIYDLYKGARLVSDKRDYNAYSAVTIIHDIALNLGEGLVRFELDTQGTKPNEIHRQYLIYKPAEIYPAMDLMSGQENYNLIETIEGEYFISEIDKMSDVKVFCSCADYKFTFDWYNYNVGLSTQITPPEPYESKGMREPRNPKQINGICKHIYNAFRFLQNEGYITK